MSLQTFTFNFTGALQTHNVLANLVAGTFSFDARGAQGGSGPGAGSYVAIPGGNGGRVQGKYAAASGDTINVYVGGQGGSGANSNSGSTTGGAGGWGRHNGGAGGNATWATSFNAWSGGGGGGSSAVLDGAVLLAEAGGGGGSSSFALSSGIQGQGGYGGNAATAGQAGVMYGGGAGTASGGGGAGTSSINGAGGAGSTGTFTEPSGAAGSGGTGGAGGAATATNGADTVGGGGGGGGNNGGGGGGAAGATSSSGASTGAGGGGGWSSAPNATSITYTDNYQTGNGVVTLSYHTGDAPSAPTLNSPANSSILDANNAVTLSWSYNPGTDSGTQNAIAIRMKLSGSSTYSYWNAGTGTWQSTIVWNSYTSNSFTLPAGSFTDGNTYNWSVATQESTFNLQGAFASDFSFTANAVPVANISAPIGTITTLTPLVSWSCADNYPQTQWQVRIFTQTATQQGGFNPATSTAAVVDSGLTNGTATSYAVSTTLSNHVTYVVYVYLVVSSGQNNNWAQSKTFTSSADTPQTPTIAVTPGTLSSGAPFNTISVQGYDNLLSAVDSSFESTSGVTWGFSNTAVAQQSSLQAADGSFSWQLIAAAAGAIVAQTGFYAVKPNYSAAGMIAFFAGSIARTCTVQVNWYTSGQVLISSTTSPNLTSSTSAWLWAVANGTAPVGAAYAKLGFTVFGCAGPLATPAAPTITTVGTAGSTSYFYKIVYHTTYGTVTSSEGSITTGNATLNGTNYNLVKWTVVAGTNTVDIWRGTSAGNENTLVASAQPVGNGTTGVNDQGGGSAGIIPTANTTGECHFVDCAGIYEYDFSNSTNLLTAADASFEDGLGSWSASSNCNVAQSSAAALDGTHSLSMTSQAAGQTWARTAQGTASLYPVTPGQWYTAFLSMKAAATPETFNMFIYWWNASGVQIGSPVQSAALTDAIGYWTQSSVTAQAPATAAYVQIQTEYNAAGANEVHYIDEIGLFAVPGPLVNMIPDTSSLATWSSGNVLASVQPFSLGGNEFVYGSSVSGSAVDTVSQRFAITPNTYILSGYIDATGVSSGSVMWAVYDASASTEYGRVTQAAGLKGVVSGTITIPNGVTEVCVILHTLSCTIPSGNQVIFAQPQLIRSNTTSPYTPGVNWLIGGGTPWANFGEPAPSLAVYGAGTAVGSVQQANGSAANAGVAVSTGQIITYSAYIDATNITAGNAYALLLDQSGNTLSSVNATNGTAGTVIGTYTVASGVTSVRLAVGVNATTVIANDTYAFFSQPNLQVNGAVNSCPDPNFQNTAFYWSPPLSWTVIAYAWSMGGYAGSQNAEIQYSYDGVTWTYTNPSGVLANQDVRNASALALSSQQQVSVTDYEQPPLTAIYYRAILSLTVGGVLLSSGYSKTVKITGPVLTNWYIRDPLNPTVTALAVSPVGQFTTSQQEQMSAFYAIGRQFPVISSDVVNGQDGTLNLVTFTTADYNNLKTILASQKVYLLQSPFGEQWYVRLLPGRQQSLQGNASTSAAGAQYRTTQVQYLQVDKP